MIRIAYEIYMPLLCLLARCLLYPIAVTCSIAGHITQWAINATWGAIDWLDDKMT